MAESNDRSIRKWVEDNSSVSAVAAELGRTRPTIYKYMEKFDSGELEKLPEDVVTYFEQKLASEDDPKYLRKKMDLVETTVILRKKLEIEESHMTELMAKREQIMFQIDFIEKASKDNPDELKKLNDMKIELEVISKESMKCSQSVNEVRARLHEVERELSELEHTKYIPTSTKQIFNIKSSCFIENGKCMVVHTGDKTTTVTVNNGPEQQEPLYYRLHLYAKVGNEYAHLGDYLPVKNRNFFIIYDVFLSAPLYYNIVACVEDPGIDDEEGEFARPDGEPNLIELSGSDSTGMCELKQKK